MPRDASDEDVARIFAVMDSTRDEAMFGLIVGAGLRVGEVSALRLSDLEDLLDQNALTKIRINGKGGTERMVWLTNSLSNALQAWISSRPEADGS